MMSEAEYDDLRFVTCALREWAKWHESCGAYGLPYTPNDQRRLSTASIAAIANTAESASGEAEDLAPPAPLTPRAEYWIHHTNPEESRSSDAKPAGAKPATTGQARVSTTIRRPVSKPEMVDPFALEAPTLPQVIAGPPTPEVILSSEERTEKLAVAAGVAKTCTRCPLRLDRKNVVYGVGPVDPDVMIVGEGPGADEDAQGVPFVGRAGQLLSRMIVSMGFERSEVYIANVVKCRPPENRTPEKVEMELCMPFLREQIDLVRPRVMIAMGATAVKGLLGLTTAISRLRGSWRLYNGTIPVMPTYHPAYLLRYENLKRDVWNDLKAVVKELGRTLPPARK